MSRQQRKKRTDINYRGGGSVLDAIDDVLKFATMKKALSVVDELLIKMDQK